MKKSELSSPARDHEPELEAAVIATSAPIRQDDRADDVLDYAAQSGSVQAV